MRGDMVHIRRHGDPTLGLALHTERILSQYLGPQPMHRMAPAPGRIHVPLAPRLPLHAPRIPSGVVRGAWPKHGTPRHTAGS